MDEKNQRASGRRYNIGDAVINIIEQNFDHHDLYVAGYYDVSVHYHFIYEMHCFDVDSIELFINDRIVSLTNKDCLILPPYIIHYPVINKGGFNHYVLQFELIRGQSEGGRDFSEYEYFRNILEGINAYEIFEINSSFIYFREKLGEIYDEFGKNADNIAGLYICALLNEICACVKAEQSKKEPHEDIHSFQAFSGKDDEDTRRIILIDQIISREYLSNITYDYLSEKLCLSRRQCIRVVRSLTGMTLGQLLIRQRMNIALSLLEKGGIGLGDIAFLSGYSSYAGFYEAFLKYFGKAPREYLSDLNQSMPL